MTFPNIIGSKRNAQKGEIGELDLNSGDVLCVDTQCFWLSSNAEPEIDYR